MKKFLILLFCIVSLSAAAQTTTELMGKWQLVKWTQKGKEKDIVSYFKTDQVFQVFLENEKFESINGKKISKGKWKLSADNSELTINTTIVPVKFKIDFFDKEKRVMTSDALGTFEYKKVEN